MTLLAKVKYVIIYTQFCVCIVKVVISVAFMFKSVNCKIR